VIATAIQDLMPVDVGRRFPATEQNLYCWTRVEADDFASIAPASRYVTHRWIHDGEVVRERKIKIESGNYRAYSVLSEPGSRPGAWWVQIVDASGRVIGSETFVIEE
jgi:hypothetical protein